MFFITSLFLCFFIAAGAHAKELSKCDKLVSLAAWKDRNTVVETTLKTLTGTWISEGCETRPGPEYVVRSYTFDSDGAYSLIQHHYWDDSCSSPKLTITSHGKLQIRNSLVQPDSVGGSAKPINITVTPQDARAARELDSLVASECPVGQFWKTWRRHEEHLVYDNRHERRPNFNLWSQYYQPISNNNHNKLSTATNNFAQTSSGDIVCLGSLKWAFNELKLIKIQFRPILHNLRKSMQKEVEMELLLGDIHSNRKRREFYSPTSFQVPLIRQSRGENITLNKYVFNIKSSNGIPTNLMSNMKAPPHLIEKPHLPPYIFGEWTSTRCEVRPLDVYLLRRFSFNENNFVWIGEHKFYSDPFCTFLKFTVTATGHFSLPGENSNLKGATNVDFQIEHATLTAVDEKVIADMKLEGFCGYGLWRANEPKDLAPTNGCIYLGIFIPSIQFDVIKVEMDYKGAWLLFLGQADTNNLPTMANERPTAFQLPLVKCGEVGVGAYGSGGFKGLLERRSLFSSKATRVCPEMIGFVIVFFYVVFKVR